MAAVFQPLQVASPPLDGSGAGSGLQINHRWGGRRHACSFDEIAVVLLFTQGRPAAVVWVDELAALRVKQRMVDGGTQAALAAAMAPFAVDVARDLTGSHALIEHHSTSTLSAAVLGAKTVGAVDGRAGKTQEAFNPVASPFGSAYAGALAIGFVAGLTGDALHGAVEQATRPPLATALGGAP